MRLSGREDQVVTLFDVFRWAAPPTVAWAHSGTESYVYVIMKGDECRANVQFPVSVMNRVLDLDMPQDAAGALRAMEANGSTIESYARDHLDIGGAPLAFTGFRTLEHGADSYAIVDFVVPSGLPRRFRVRYDGIIHFDHHHSGMILVRKFDGIGPLQAATEQRFVCEGDAVEHDVSVAEDSLSNDLRGVYRAARRSLKRAKRRVQRARA